MLQFGGFKLCLGGLAQQSPPWHGTEQTVDNS